MRASGPPVWTPIGELSSANIITRAMQHDCVLYRNPNGETVAFIWRSAGEQVGPEFVARELAVDWMAERLNGLRGSPAVET